MLRRIVADDDPRMLVAPGDDAAVVEPGPGSLVLTADLLVEGVHFRRETISARDLGYKAVAVNVSDVAAMGASPRYALVSLACPADLAPAWLVELHGGIRDAAAEYALHVAGGDVTRADAAVVSVALTGEAPRGRAITRAGARPGDVVAVTGELGAAAGGLLLTESAPHEAAAVAGTEWARDLLRAFSRPHARVGEGAALAAAGASAMIDVSDGLALDLTRLCAASGVGARVRLDALPVAAGLRPLAAVLHADPLALALGGGEDYELLVTLPAAAVSTAAAVLHESFGTPLTVVGEVTERSGVVALDAAGAERPLEPSGWDHLAG